MFINQRYNLTAYSNSNVIPSNILHLIFNYLPVAHNIIFNTGLRTQDALEECEAEILTHICKVVTHKIRKLPKCLDWPTSKWTSLFNSATKDAVIHVTQYMLFPFSVPKPLRLSLFKYHDLLKILSAYHPLSNVSQSDLFRALVVMGCSPLTKCNTCRLNFSSCPIPPLPISERRWLYKDITRKRSVLVFYAKRYRKTLESWLKQIDELRRFTVDVDSAEWTADYEMEDLVTFSDIKRRMSSVHPDLFKIMCFTMSAPAEDPTVTGILPTPTGWLSKDIKEAFHLSKNELSKLLEQGDRIINEYRRSQGLLPLQRGVQSKSTN
jgi:hypothetical protein